MEAAPVVKMVDPEAYPEMTTEQLLKLHDAVHCQFRGGEGEASARLIGHHLMIVKELVTSRGVNHPRPPWDALDWATKMVVDCEQDEVTTEKALVYQTPPGQEVFLQLREEVEEGFATDLFYAHRHDEDHERMM
jgi:hypothetical protein